MAHDGVTQFEEIIASSYEKFTAIPPHRHLLCPKVDDDDAEDYNDLENTSGSITLEEKMERIKEGKERLRTSYWASLILAYPRDKSGVWLANFSERMEFFLRACDKCVLNWHMGRKAALQRFSEKWQDDATVQLERDLRQWDFARLDNVISWAKELIESVEAEGHAFKKAMLGERQGDVLLAIYECLCCLPYLSLPEKRINFQYVFKAMSGKKPLKLGADVLLPAMTEFLFDTDTTRLAFAHNAWSQLGSVSEAQFDWAIHDVLDAHIREVAQFGPDHRDAYPKIQQFWEAFVTILRPLDEHRILHSLRGMEVSPNVYELLFQHMPAKSEGILINVIKALSGLLEKSPKAFWDAIGDARPIVIVESVFSTPLFRTLLSQSLELGMGNDNVDAPFTISWIPVWLASIRRDQKSDACESLLLTLFEQLIVDPNLGEQGKAACLRAGLDALEALLGSFLDSRGTLNTGTTLLYVNATLGLVLRFASTIAAAVDTEAPEYCTFRVQQKAIAVIKAALQLDTKATFAECESLHNDLPVQQAVPRDSAALWEAFVDLTTFGSRRIEIGTEMLTALIPLATVEQIRPPRKGTNPRAEERKAFNTSLGKAADVIGRLIQRLTELGHQDIRRLCLNSAAYRSLVLLSMHSENPIREAATEFLKTMTNESSRSEALLTALRSHFDETLPAYNFAFIQYLKSPHPWGPMRHLMKASRDVLNGLCDSSNGLLRTQFLDSFPKFQAVSAWWLAQWNLVEQAFNQTEAWSLTVELDVMQDFCREVIDLAESLLAQDGLLTSATARWVTKETTLEDQERKQMRALLSTCQRHCFGMVRMIRLKDEYLVNLTVEVLVKLLRRFREYDLRLPVEAQTYVESACIPSATGGYSMPTNLTSRHKAALLKVIRADEDSDIEIVAIAKVEKPKKQSTIDAWSKSGATARPGAKLAELTASRTNKDDVLELSSTVDKHRATLDAMAARQAKTKTLPPQAKVLPPQAKALPPRPKLDAKPLLAPTPASIKESRQRAKEERMKRDAAAIARAAALRGVVGKDHGQPKSEMMVDSEDEASGDSDGEDQFAGLMQSVDKDRQARRAAESRLERAKRLVEKGRGPVKKVKQVRSAKDMRARLIPPMDTLHQAILEWDIFHEGESPPNSVDRKEVSDTYQHALAYKQTFLPLLISEAWRSFVTAKDECTSKPFGIRVATRMNVDRFLEMTATMPLGENKDRQVAEGDILLLSRSPTPLTDSGQPHCLARIWKIKYKKDIMEVTYRLNGKTNQLSSDLAPGHDVYAVRITNMTTIEREYAALESLQYYDLCTEILTAEPSPILNHGDDLVRTVMGNYKLNSGQAKAILGARDNDGFTLVQGPPGTGKTKTIIAMVGVLLTGHITRAPVQNGAGVPNAPAHSRLSPQKKLLICAPSNAAVDELVLRLKQGVKTTNGITHPVNVLRLGRSDAISAAVKDVTLDELVAARLTGDKTKENAKAAKDQMHNEAARIKAQLAELRPALEAARESGDRSHYSTLQREFDNLKRQQASVGAKIDADKDSGNTLAREFEIRKKQVQQEILDQAQVLCATLSGSGHEMFKNLNVEFETVIIDEAAQCVELSAIIPLKYGATKCILVGDPKQLPPTVLSQSAAKYGYDQSLFVRMQRNHPESVFLLDQQYRMHPDISLFPSREFYEGRLLDGADMAPLRRQPWHESALLGPYRFFDVKGTQEKGRRGQSLVNVEELKVAMQLYERFRTDFPKEDVKGRIGIITPYKAQLGELRASFSERYGAGIMEQVEFNTTDAFQGRECEIIIFSCVRASATGGIGFMTDIRRMNVGLTRAKSSLWILGDSRALVQGEYWRKLIEDAQRRDRYTSGDILGMLRRRGIAGEPPVKELPMREPSAKQPPRQPPLRQPPAKQASARAPSLPGVGPDPLISVGAPPPQGLATQDLRMQDPQDMSTHQQSYRPPEWNMPDRMKSSDHEAKSFNNSLPSGRPMIHSSVGMDPARLASYSNKRPRDPATDDSSDAGATKRHMQAQPRGPKQKPKKARDPSAMQALGLVPPPRPPPQAKNSFAGKSFGSGGRPGAQGGGKGKPSSHP